MCIRDSPDADHLYRDEFPDDQPVADEVEMIAHAARHEMLRPARVVIVAVVADFDQRMVDHRLQEGRALPAGDRMARAGICLLYTSSSV